MSILRNHQIPQPTVRKENGTGYVILPILLGMLKGILDNEVVASTPVVATKLRGLIKELVNDKNLARRILELGKQAVSNSEIKKFNKEVEKIIRELANKPTDQILTMLVASDTHVPLSNDQYEAVVEGARTMYLYCPTKAQEKVYREQIKDFDHYIEWFRIVLLSAKEMPTFMKIPSVGFFYSPKDIELASINRQIKLTSIDQVQKVLDLDKASLNLV